MSERHLITVTRYHRTWGPPELLQLPTETGGNMKKGKKEESPRKERRKDKEATLLIIPALLSPFRHS